MSSNTNTISLGSTFSRGIWKENPVLRLLLGMCPTLAVTGALKPAITMSICVMFVLTCSNIVVSLMRNLLKPHLRIMMFTLTIATFVTIADLAVKAFAYEMSQTLGPYIPLIIVNCIIIGRAEACASKNNLVVSIVDAIGMSVGFALALCAVAAARELLAAGTLMDFSVMPDKFVPWAAMSMPVGAFVVLGLLLGFINAITNKSS